MTRAMSGTGEESTASGPSGGQHRNVTRAAVLTAVGGILFGYDTGVVGGVLPNISKDFSLNTPFDKGLVVAILLAGAAVGALLAGRIADQIGRRRMIFLTSVVFVVGLLLSSLAPTLWVFWISRSVIGLGVHVVRGAGVHR